jgi:hypothetical protein
MNVLLMMRSLPEMKRLPGGLHAIKVRRCSAPGEPKIMTGYYQMPIYLNYVVDSPCRRCNLSLARVKPTAQKNTMVAATMRQNTPG